MDGEKVQRRRPQLVLRGEHEKHQEGNEHHGDGKGVNRSDAPQQELLVGGFLLQPHGRHVRLRGSRHDGLRALLDVVGRHLNVRGDLFQPLDQLGHRLNKGLRAIIDHVDHQVRDGKHQQHHDERGQPARNSIKLHHLDARVQDRGNQDGADQGDDH